MTTLDTMLRELVDDLLVAIDEVTGEWRPCWSRTTSLPHNAQTGVPYRGANTIILWAAQLRSHYTTPTWATYKQWLALGGQVRKGETGQHCVKWVVPTPKDDATTNTKTRGLIPTSFVVFNSQQQDGWSADTHDGVAPGDLFAEWQRMIAAVPAKYIEGKPCYVPALDLVSLPPSFNDPALGAGVISHELAHWTGHADRLARDLSGRFGDEAYAGEELVAEISAAMTCNLFGLPAEVRRDDHARYVKHWLAVLDNDPKLLMTAATAAQKATDHLLSYSEDTTPWSPPPTSTSSTRSNEPLSTPTSLLPA